jgi:hypothetical protein
VSGMGVRRTGRGIDGVKVFSASRDRAGLGDAVTTWLEARDVVVVDITVTQSSDRDFHCLSIAIFFRRRA